MTHPLPPPSTTSSSKKRNLAPILILLALSSLWLYTLKLPFLDLDDPIFITHNPIVKAGLSRKLLAWAFTTNVGDYWHPLTWISLALDSSLFGNKPWGYHLTNALLHTANVLLVYTLFRQTTRNLGPTLTNNPSRNFGPSLFAAALFAIHPQRVESVAWITERKDVLAAFFGLLAILAYLRFIRSPNPTRYLLVCLLFLCSLLAKPLLVTLPALLLVLDYWPLQRFRTEKFPHLLREKIPLFLLACAAALNTMMYVSNGVGLRGTWQSSVSNALVNYSLYLRDLFYFRDLALFYRAPTDLPLWQPLAATALLLAITAAILLTLKHPRAKSAANPLLAGWLWFLIAMFPTSGILQNGYSMRGDRFTYIPSLGLIILLVWGLPAALNLHAPHCHHLRRIALILAAAIILLLSLCTLNRLQLWRNPLALYQHDLKLDPDNAYLQQAAGIAAKNRHLPNLAQQYFRRATQLDPREFLDGIPTTTPSPNHDKGSRHQQRAR